MFLFKNYLPFCKLIILRRLGITRARPWPSSQFRSCRDTESCPPLDRPYPVPTLSQPPNHKSIFKYSITVTPQIFVWGQDWRGINVSLEQYEDILSVGHVYSLMRQLQILDRSSFHRQWGPVKYTSRQPLVVTL